jgi:hypothetical protein
VRDIVRLTNLQSYGWTWVSLVVGGLSLTLPALAQTNLAVQYDFNGGGTGTLVPSLNNSNVDLTVTNVSTLAGVTQTFASGAFSTDPVTPSTNNQGANTTTYPALGGGNLTAGVQILLPTSSASGGFSNIVIRYDQRQSNAGSRFSQFQHTTNGTDYIAGPSFEAFLGDQFLTRTVDLSSITAANNNANLAIRVLAQFDPATGNYSAANPTSTYAPGGTIRYDMVTAHRGFRWQGGSGTDITTAANYQGGTAPQPVDALLFGAGANTTVNVGTAQSVGPIVFQTGAPSYTITGQALTISAGLANNSTNAQTISAPLAYALNQTIQNNGQLLLNGNQDLATGVRVQVGGTGTTLVNGTVTNAGTAGRWQIGAGQTLGGIGTFSNTEVFIWNGRIRGGASNGTNNFGTLTVGGVANLDLEIQAAPGNRGSTFLVEATRTAANTVNSSKIVVAGDATNDLELNGAGVAGNLYAIEVIAANLVNGETYQLQVVTTPTGGIEEDGASRTNGYVFPAGTYTLVSSNTAFVNPTLSVISDLAGVGTDTLVLTFTASPVPEPTSVLALGGLSLAVAFWRRRRAV